MCECQKNQSVSDFYAGQSVFITGGAGFLGKVIIEKLLYTCKDVDKIYMLIRDKKGVCAEERIKQILDKPLFSRLKQKRPEDVKKIIPIIGDITEPGLGLCSEDRQRLQDEVSVVIHSAATVKFNEPLKIAMNVNLEGTRHVLNLCHQMKQIKVFVYVSTAYSNTIKPVVEEALYPPPASLDEVYAFVGEHGEDDERTRKFLNGRPNTYTFTKALAENLVAENCGGIPTVIIRPSIVTPSKAEPLVGWVDKIFGSTAVLVLAAKGICRIIYGEGHVALDMVPVDYVSNITLVAAAKGTSTKEVKIYNCCSSTCNPISKRRLVHLYLDESLKQKSYAVPYPYLMINPHECLVAIVSFLTMTIAYVADAILSVLGKKPVYKNYVAQARQVRNVLKYFTSQSWEMKSENTCQLYASLSPSDKVDFPCDITDIDWDEYMRDYARGVEKYLLRPYSEKLEGDKKTWQ